MPRKNISRRTFLKGLGAAAGGAAFSNVFFSGRAFAQNGTPDVMFSADLALTPEEIEEIASMNLRFGFNMNHRTDDFINQVIAGGEATAEEYGIELLVGEANFDAAKQLADVEALVQQEVDAIFMIAVDSDSISRAILQANEAGIPIVVVGGPPTRGEILSLMNSTSYNGCFESCQFLTESVGGVGKIGVISIPLALSTIRDRETGTLDAIGESQMQLIGLQPVFSQDEALAAAENMIQAHPDLTAIFATWSLAVNGTLAAVEASGNDIKVSGYDAEVAGFMAFHEGNPHLLSLSGQQGRQQGRTGLDALCKNILGQPVAPDILVPTVLVTADDYQEKWEELYPGVPVPWEEAEDMEEMEEAEADS